MAAGLPAILLAYEMIYHWPNPSEWGRWLYQRRAIWVVAAMTAIAFQFRQTATSPFHGVPDYRVIISAQRYFETTLPLVSQMFFLHDDAFNAAEVVVLFALMWATAIALRNKAMMLGAAIVILAPLPVNFITYRGFFVMYLPMLGWALYLAALLAGLKDWIAARIPRVRHLDAALLLATAALMFAIERQDTVWTFEVVDVNQVLIRGMRQDLSRIRPAFPKNGRVLFLKQAFDADSYNPLYIVRLLYRSAGIAVDCAHSSRAPSPAKPESYDLVLAYCGRHYIENNTIVCPTE
jgi:hypothetical protein